MADLTPHRPIQIATHPTRVFGWMADQQGCGAYRISIPLEHLDRQPNWECKWDGELSGYNWRWADIVVAQRTWLPRATEVWQKVARLPDRPKLVYEIDDDLFDIASENPAANTYNNPDVQRNMRLNAEVADLVTVSTDRLAEVLSRYNGNVAVLPNCIPGWLLDQPANPRDDGIVTIGWQGSPTHAMDWDGPAAQVERFFRRYNRGGVRVELHTIGALGRYLPNVVPHRHTGWLKRVDDAWARADWHIGLAPLKHHPFNRAKSDVRLLELAAKGTPVVASDAGPYTTSVQDGQTGYLVRQDHQWSGWLRELADNPDERARMGAYAYWWAQTRTIELNAHLWEKAYLS